MKILICNDGSEQAEKAMRLGTAIAAASRADVTLFGILESGNSQLVLDSLKRGQSLLEDRKIHAELITKPGEPIHEIISRTEQAPYDLVVIGAVRKENRGPFWMSSKSYKIIKEVAPPVLVVAGKLTEVRRILVCSGGIRHADPTLHLIGHIARGSNAHVTLFHVMPELPGIFYGLHGMEETVDWLLASHSELGVNLRHEKQTLEAMGAPVDVRLGQGPVLDVILSELQEGNYDLVVSGSALSRGLRTYIMGDITREIVNHTDCAVLVVRNPEEMDEPRGLFLGWLGKRR
jgi:nucleotide-binding universal stress UspA family protein